LPPPEVEEAGAPASRKAPALHAAVVRGLRGSRPAVDPWTPFGSVEEEERQPDGSIVHAATLFLAGAECPWACVFCDLWRYTLEGETPPGAIPRQIRAALAALRQPPSVVKFYNASNFFESRAVPEADDEAIAALVRTYDRVVVECHPRLVGERATAFARRIGGRLEVALGLETIDARAAPRLGKGATLDDFARAAATLHGAGIDVRVFLLVGAPYVPASEQVASIVASARFATIELGAVQVALIPVRSGNGALERLAAEGSFTPPDLALVEDAFDACLATAPTTAVVAVDLWDLERLASCSSCFPARRARLERANLTGAREPRIECSACRSRTV
jgi:radical SAM enzyme (TIGR01210 family)